MGLHKRVIRRKAFLPRDHKSQHLNPAKHYLDKPELSWNQCYGQMILKLSSLATMTLGACRKNEQHLMKRKPLQLFRMGLEMVVWQSVAQETVHIKRQE